jgi:hypothetical protein
MCRVEFEGPERPNGGSPPTGVLVIRVWREPESPAPFRARIIAGSMEGGEHTIGYARSRTELVAAVNRWLDAMPNSGG